MKKAQRLLLSGALLNGLSLSLLQFFSVHTHAQNLALGTQRLRTILNNFAKLEANTRVRLSPGLQTFVAMAKQELVSRPTSEGFAGHSFSPDGLAAGMDSFPVSDPRLDFVLSSTSGFSQFQSSTAWCGNNIVTGYTDTGASLRATGNLTLDGVSVSDDNGNTFIDLGGINTNPNSPNNDQLLTGDSVVACGGDQFVYASTGFDDDNVGGGGSAILVSHAQATDLSHWSPPEPAVDKGFSEFFLQTPWLAADPSHPQQLYLTYVSTDNGFNGSPPCEIMQTLELVNSQDGGFTWSAPVVLDSECQGGEFGTSSPFSIAGATTAVSSSGRLYVVYLASGSPSEVRFLQSTDHGATFSPTRVIASITPPGNPAAFALQGQISNQTLPAIAVDRSSTRSHDAIYIAWDQGGRTVTLSNSTYSYADIAVARSDDLGAHFTPLGLVSPTPKGFTGPGRDQFTPSLAVDARGFIQLCYYDRRNDPNNMAIDRFCSASPNRGHTWIDQRVSAPNWLPVYTDAIRSSLGVYDTVVTDFLQQNTGFIATFEFITAGNPDILGAKLGQTPNH